MSHAQSMSIVMKWEAKVGPGSVYLSRSPCVAAPTTFGGPHVKLGNNIIVLTRQSPITSYVDWIASNAEEKGDERSEGCGPHVVYICCVAFVAGVTKNGVL